MNNIKISLLSLSVSALVAGGAVAGEHFHPKGKEASAHTIAHNQHLRTTLPFADQRDFDEQKRGFIAAPDLSLIHI